MENKQFRAFRAEIIVKSFIVTAIIAIGGAIFGNRLFSVGYVIGYLLALSSFANMYNNINKIASGQVKKIKLYLALRFFVFYLVMALALVAAASKGRYMFIGVVAGFISMKLVIFINGLFSGRKKTQNTQ